MHKLITSTVAALSLGTFATPALAEAVTVTVPYADLDFSSATGIATLNGRIEAAAKRICGSADIRNMHDVSDQQRCLHEAQDAAGKQVALLRGSAQLLAFNVSRPRK
jgi:UrcA family protein